MSGWVNAPYQSEAPDALVERQPGLDEGGSVKAPPPLSEADSENIIIATSSRDLPPVGDHCSHISRHAQFLTTELARSLPEAAIDRLVSHLKRHIDQLRPYSPTVKDGPMEEAGRLAKLMLAYKERASA